MRGNPVLRSSKEIIPVENPTATHVLSGLTVRQRIGPVVAHENNIQVILFYTIEYVEQVIMK